MSATRYRTMVEAIEDLKKRGFTANFEFLDQKFRDVDTGRVFDANDLTIVKHYRFEGTSDPDDSCPGTKPELPLISTPPGVLVSRRRI